MQRGAKVSAEFLLKEMEELGQYRSTAASYRWAVAVGEDGRMRQLQLQSCRGPLSWWRGSQSWKDKM